MQTRRVRLLLTALTLSAAAIIAGATGASGAKCIGYTYDGTGNRTTATTAPDAPTWGSTLWGCLTWTSP
jgi:hypothetical protein